MRWRTCLGVLLGLIAQTAYAEDLPAAQILSELRSLRSEIGDLKGIVGKQQKRIDKLETENSRLKAETVLAQGAGPAPSPEPVVVARTGSSNGAPSGGLSAFNPEIGAVADITTFLSDNSKDEEGNDKISVRELELILGHDVDPFSRLDAVITFSDFEDVDIEEAYLTHWGIPGGFKAKLGRMRPQIGKASAVHRDQLDTADSPLVVQEYLGVEGLFRTGLEFTNFLPLPWENVIHQLTFGILEGGVGEGGTLLGGTRRRPTLYAHLKNFWEMSDATNFEVGGTYLTGSSDDDSKFEVNLFGVDATLVHFFTPSNKFKLQSEIYLQDRGEGLQAVESGETAPGFRRHPYGAYVLADYRLSPRFGLGTRLDYVQHVESGVGQDQNGDRGVTGYLTYYQSEFSRWRAQYQYVDRSEGGDDSRFWLQGTFAIGVHKHQLQ